MSRSFSPEAWNAVHRMHMAGCSLDPHYLRRRYAPVQVFSRPCQPAFFSVDRDQFYFQIHVQIVAQMSVTITGWDLEANWLPAQVEWAEKCPQHKGFYCLHPAFAQEATTMLQSWLRYHQGKLSRGMCIEGILAGCCPGISPPRNPGVCLKATFIVYDGQGYRFEYPIQI